MSENIISWNIANWITILLMAIGGYAIFVLATKFIGGNGGADD